MKKCILLTIVSLFSIGIITAQNDTIYIMKDGNIIYHQNVSEIDSIIFYKPIMKNYFTFIDQRDSNIYKAVIIANQVWMAENLKYLPSVVGTATISSTNPYYYVYDYDGTDVKAAKSTTNYNTYGVLYNWLAAMDGNASSDTNPSDVRGVCPVGWHLPSTSEWAELIDALGGENAGGKLKEIGTTHWKKPNTGATNESGFTALPGGTFYNLNFLNMGFTGYWWTSTQLSSTIKAYYQYANYDDTEVNFNFGYIVNEELGLSIRCVKD